MKSKIFFIRHAFTPANNVAYNNQSGIAESICYDEEVPLEKKYGKKQAIELGEFLRGLTCGKTNLFIVSPYKRTMQTLEIALSQLENLVGVRVVQERAIREISTGINFARTKKELLRLLPEEAHEYYDLKQGNSKEYIPYIQGESLKEVRSRVHDFSRRLKKLSTLTDSEQNLQYDNIFIVGHSVVNQWIYYWINGQEKMTKKLKNCEVMVGNGEKRGESIFVPQTLVPKGYEVDVSEYEQERIIAEFKALVKGYNEKFGKNIDIDFIDSKISIVNRDGFDLLIPSTNTKNKGNFLIDSKQGHDCYSYDSESVQTYHVLEGKGIFIVDGEEVEVEEGSVITIKPCSTFYYEGTMKMVEEMEPNFKEENFHMVKSVSHKKVEYKPDTKTEPEKEL